MNHIKLLTNYRYFERNQIMLFHYLRTLPIAICKVVWQRPSEFNPLKIAGCTDTNHTLSIDDVWSPANGSLKTWLTARDNITFQHGYKQKNKMKLDKTEWKSYKGEKNFFLMRFKNEKKKSLQEKLTSEDLTTKLWLVIQQI